MGNELSALKRRWLDHGSFEDEQAYLRVLVRQGRAPFVFLDPDGSLPPWLGVIVRRETGVVFGVQCAGVATEERLVEGYYVPLGGSKYDLDDGEIEAIALNEIFHEGDACRWGHQASELPAARLAKLSALIEHIPYWRCGRAGPDEKHPLRIDGARIGQIAEAWVPVKTPDGPGILVYNNCD